MDGHELIAVLRETAPHLPIITASGFDARPKVGEVQSGRHLPKPYTSEALVRMVSEVLQARVGRHRPIAVAQKG
jgi:CheY-like chemotaxis protein